MNDQELQFDPLLTDIHPNGSTLTSQENVALWLCLQNVSDEVYQLLISSLLANALQRLQQKLHITDVQTSQIAAVLKLFYLKKIPLENIELLLKTDVGLPQDTVSAAMNFIQTEVLPLKAPETIPTEDAVASVPQFQGVALPLLDALAQYSRINDQLITSERIRIRSEKDLVRGSVRNWLRAYRDVVGARKHTAVERGQFLFQADNTKKLSSQDREKLAVILKSLDENEVLQINPDKQEILFSHSATSAETPLSQRPIVDQSPITTPPAFAYTAPKAAPSNPFGNTQSASFVSRNQSPATTQIKNQAPLPQHAPQTPPKNFNFSQATPDTSPVQPLHTAPQLSSEKYGSIASPASQKPAFTQTPPASLPVSGDAPAETFQFSSGQTLPAEKQTTTSAKYALKPQPLTTSSFGLGYSSGIAPTAQKKEVWGIPASLQNVVDLRGEE